MHSISDLPKANRTRIISPPYPPGRERGVLINAKQAFQLSPFCLLYYGGVTKAH